MRPQAAALPRVHQSKLELFLGLIGARCNRHRLHPSTTTDAMLQPRGQSLELTLQGKTRNARLTNSEASKFHPYSI